MTKTRLYLDVDGVINAMIPEKAWGDRQEGIGTVEGYSYRITWAPAMLDALLSLDLELVWLTTWRSDALASIAPLVGYGHEGRVLHPNNDPDAHTTFPSIDWKVEALMVDQENDPSPFIWCDDEIDIQQQRITDVLGGLALSIDPVYGIKVEDIEMMRGYLSSLPKEVEPA